MRVDTEFCRPKLHSPLLLRPKQVEHVCPGEQARRDRSQPLGRKPPTKANANFQNDHEQKD
jgi:hypothetical protein